MAIARYDLTVQDAQGRALSGAQVYFCTQPANTTTTPPSPLATIYADTSGDFLAQPVITDGFGHAYAYMDNSVLYTVVVDHPLFPAPMVYVDQTIGGGNAGTGVLVVQATTQSGTITGTIPGFNFTLPSAPLNGVIQLVQNGLTLTVNVGYALSGTSIILATPLASGEGLSATYLVAS